MEKEKELLFEKLILGDKEKKLCDRFLLLVQMEALLDTVLHPL